MIVPSKRFAWSIAVVAVVCALPRMLPHPPLRQRFPLSTAVWSADGELLRVTRADDDQYRLWVPLSGISPELIEAFLLKEDRWFYWSVGVNPVSLARAALHTHRGDRQGASTVTMQLARLTYHLNTRRPSGKLRQIAAAVWLEWRYSKREILEAYLNAVPFGGNIQGVGAASRIYFGKLPDRITLGEALTLAVIPQHPERRAGRNASDESALAARARLGLIWLKHHGDGADDRRQIALPIVARSQMALPWMAPHLVDSLLATHRRPGRIDTTIDTRLQRLVEGQIARHVAEHGEVGIRNASALLVDTRDMSIKASVGSADYWNDVIDGQVNGVTAKRSPGSALKPFVYALALDQGVLHPQTMLRDAPTSFGPFTPENFDGRFFGPISAEEALIRSRNIPAVWVATQLKQPSLYQFLRAAGVRDLKSEAYYGLALALGGGEVTMEELASLYGMLANGGVMKPLHVERDTRAADGVRLLSEEASFVTLEMLRHNPRPDSDPVIPLRTQWPVAWKTGTSWAFRDAWSAGIAGPYVLVVWIGNFDGRGNPAFIGVDAAAPLFFRIVDALNLALPSETNRALQPPPGVRKVAVCAGSGDLPNADCPHTVDTWYIPGKSPIRVSQLHRRIAVDGETGRPVCRPYPPGTRFEIFEFWPSDMLKLFKEAGMPRRTPPALPGCVVDNFTDTPNISSPLRNVSYTLRRSKSETVVLEASVGADVRRVFWFDGSSLVASRSRDDGAMAWQPSAPGHHVVRVVDDHGRSAERDVEIQFAR